MHAIGKVTTGIFAIFVFFVLPISYHGEKQDALNQVFVQNQTQRFADNIRLNGYLDEAMYQSFLTMLDRTEYLYEIRMDHAHKVVEPALSESGEVTGYYEYFESTYEDDIMDAVESSDGIYTMVQGDYISVTVVNRSETYRDFIDRMFYAGKTQEHSIYATAGGYILDEAADGRRSGE